MAFSAAFDWTLGYADVIGMNWRVMGIGETQLMAVCRRGAGFIMDFDQYEIPPYACLSTSVVVSFMELKAPFYSHDDRS